MPFEGKVYLIRGEAELTLPTVLFAPKSALSKRLVLLLSRRIVLLPTLLL